MDLSRWYYVEEKAIRKYQETCNQSYHINYIQWPSVPSNQNWLIRKKIGKNWSLSPQNNKNHLLFRSRKKLLARIVGAQCVKIAYSQLKCSLHRYRDYDSIVTIYFLTHLSWITSSGTYVKEFTLRCTNFFFFNFAVFQIADYFSYEHFYVIYCKFWELDTDHDLLIDENDLMRHNNHGKYVMIVNFL